MDDKHIIAFADATDEHEVTQPFYSFGHGHTVFTAPVEIGKLDYITSLDVHVDNGTIDHFRFIDCNGTPIIMVSGEMLALLENHVPISLDPRGTGALANMSNACPYRIEIIGKCEGRITYHGRNLPHPVAHDGTPVATVPPHIGTLQMWNSILNIIVDKGWNRTEVHRVGNHIKELIFVFKDRQRFCIDAPVIEWDLRLMHDDEVRIDHPSVGVYCVTFPRQPNRMLPTIVPTVLALQYVSPYKGTVDLHINDVAAPLHA